jgi:hypothetical protein
MRFPAPLLLSILLALPVSLAGCIYSWDPSTEEATIIRPGNFKAGSGTIQSVGVLPGARPADAPQTGDTKGQHPDRNLYRLSILMDAGGFQTVDIDNSRFLAGEAIEITNDGRVLRVTGTTLRAR